MENRKRKEKKSRVKPKGQKFTLYYPALPRREKHEIGAHRDVPCYEAEMTH